MQNLMILGLLFQPCSCFHWVHLIRPLLWTETFSFVGAGGVLMWFIMNSFTLITAASHAGVLCAGPLYCAFRGSCPTSHNNGSTHGENGTFSANSHQCPSMFDPRSPVCLTCVSAPYRTLPWPLQDQEIRNCEKPLLSNTTQFIHESSCTYTKFEAILWNVFWDMVFMRMGHHEGTVTFELWQLGSNQFILDLSHSGHIWKIWRNFLDAFLTYFI